MRVPDHLAPGGPQRSFRPAGGRSSGSPQPGYHPAGHADQEKDKQNLEEVRRELANSLYAASEFEEAIRVADQALEERPTQESVLVIRARSLERLQRYEEAEKAYGQLLRVNPENTEAYYGRARSLIRLQKYQEAVPLLEKSLSLDPEQSRVERLLEWLMKKLESE